MNKFPPETSSSRRARRPGRLPWPFFTSLLRTLRRSAVRNRLLRTLLFIGSIALFTLAIELVKGGAQGAAALLERYIVIRGMAHALGLGWFSSYVLMSGSPVAAVSVAFLDAGALNRLEAFGMIAGSRLGASFIVLFIGFLYILRGHERRTGLAMGLLALVVTASVYLPALAIGALLLRSGVLDFVQLDRGAVLSSALEQVFQPLVGPVTAWLPSWGVFLVGMGILWISFYLFDRALPDLHLEHSGFGRIAHLVYRPLVMFFLGSAITFITLSVSLSLSLLVPLSARGYVRRENAIPYIMGANITTFVDTVLATLLIGNRAAFTVVFVSMVSVMLVSLVVLPLFFRHFERGVLGLVQWSISSNRNLALFMFTILAVPLVLLLF
jgi:sodium-dependent phosphate cotransporter